MVVVVGLVVCSIGLVVVLFVVVRLSDNESGITHDICRYTNRDAYIYILTAELVVIVLDFFPGLSKRLKYRLVNYNSWLYFDEELLIRMSG